MVIQRWQSVLLFLACAAMVLCCIFPVAWTPGGQGVTLGSHPWWLVVGIASAALLLVAIFMYRDLARQMLATLVGAAAVVTDMCAVAFEGILGPESLSPSGLAVLMPVALVLAILAWMRMRADRRTLASYDRIR